MVTCLLPFYSKKNFFSYELLRKKPENIMSGTSNGELSPSAAFDDGAAADINNPFNKNDG